ncbi:SusD/RagB family nutrient-binding outer membrane lipoprotein [Mucilaginibacter sp. UR6-1]|uniref:RagB/SusD family nutrient uptake outer membrane protein n=1 Tax=Mucilaginibacter sp. UR6-1 TaxID=1435643 RepID=UPI001E2FFC08|nr:RagB/SusD family nutrient uptake outer membrane protein [Mucilaginibacter sp. UR6-1]MCC8408566.1 SusD/RagB family nutrient-binding outer membrane lipoprotein [Mucilaginibacter sp. UR6-1]
MTKIFNVFNNKTAALCCIGLLLLHSSCTKNFEDFNTNENQATEEMLQTDNLSTGSLIVQMEKNVFPIAQQPMFGDEVYQVMQNLAGDSYAGYMGTTNNFLSGANNTTYALVPGWYGQAFSRAFVGVMPAWKRIAKSAKTQTPEVYAIANIIKVEALHRTTDMYGPLPYVNFGETTSQGRYDSQKDIYDKFFDELDEAIEILTDFNTRFPTTKTLTSYDFIYGGNIPNWIKFANSLKLRLAMRIAYADPNKAKVEAEAAVSHKIGVMSSATDIAALQHSSSLVYNHPLFIIANPDNFNDTRMGAVMDSYLNGLKDPRLPKYFNAASDGTYRGIRSGININNKATYASGTFSTLNIEASANITWFNPAEAYFLRAEGAIRGWNMGGTAQSLYEQGIKTSFELNSVSASADTYISNETNTPANYSDPRNGANSASASSSITVKWNDAASFETKLERIITQKWIAVYPDGQEAWSEFRRTGYPKIFPVVVNNSQGQISTDVQIRRLPFPVNEYQNNRAGVNQGIALLGGNDNGGTKLWWDKK